MNSAYLLSTWITRFTFTFPKLFLNPVFNGRMFQEIFFPTSFRALQEPRVQSSGDHTFRCWHFRGHVQWCLSKSQVLDGSFQSVDSYIISCLAFWTVVLFCNILGRVYKANKIFSTKRYVKQHSSTRCNKN